MSDTLLFLGCALVALAYLAILARYRTLLFGFNALNVFVVASAGLSGFVIAMIFDLPLDWFSEDHARVVAYMVPGLLAMAAGIYMGWRPLSPQSRTNSGLYVPFPQHFTAQVGWLTFAVGAVAELTYPFAAGVPTLSTAVNCVTTLTRLGLCILLVHALHTKAWERFLVALVAFAILSIAGAFLSGFSFIRINTLIPLVLIWVVFHGLTFRNVIGLAIVVPASIAAVGAWLDTRMLIRAGSLEGLPWFEKAATFFEEYVANLAFPTRETLFRAAMERADMTNILSAQVAYQPDIEPYARGETVLSSFYTLIPRAIWPEKPEVAGGSAFVTQFTGIQRPVDDPTSIGLPYPFELYANGGALWVVAGLALVGFVCARLELRLLSRQHSLGGFWALGVVTAVLCEGGQRADVVLPALVASAISAYAVGWLIQTHVLGRGKDWAMSRGAN